VKASSTCCRLHFPLKVLDALPSMCPAPGHHPNPGHLAWLAVWRAGPGRPRRTPPCCRC